MLTCWQAIGHPALWGPDQYRQDVWNAPKIQLGETLYGDSPDALQPSDQFVHVCLYSQILKYDHLVVQCHLHVLMALYFDLVRLVWQTVDLEEGPEHDEFPQAMLPPPVPVQTFHILWNARLDNSFQDNITIVEQETFQKWIHLIHGDERYITIHLFHGAGIRFIDFNKVRT